MAAEESSRRETARHEATPVVPSARRTPLVADLGALAARAVERGTEHLLSLQREDGRWCAELESNPTITAEYVLLNQIVRPERVPGLGGKRSRIIRYFLGLQNADGSWGITPAGGAEGDVSSTVEVYLALRILGLDRQERSMRLAEEFIRAAGGLRKIRIFTRVSLAMFGLIPWNTVPALPPELILLPARGPASIYALSSWARGTMVPLFVIFHHRPVFALPNGRSVENDWLDHLWLDLADKSLPYAPPWHRLVREHGVGWKSFFCITDACLQIYERARVGAVRKIALEECIRWILRRQEDSGDWSGIFPPMLNSIIALMAAGHAPGSDPVCRGLEAIERFAWEDDEGWRVQACVSPVWDTVLAAISLIDSGSERGSAPLRKAERWLIDRQLRVERGDWKVFRPNLPQGGWAFEYVNSWYPDVDDTAAAVIALLKRDAAAARTEPVRRAVRWLLGMQNRDGGWAAFDVENNKLYLNHVHFADIDSLCDPSSPDVTGRVIEALGWFRETSAAETELAVGPALMRALRYLRQGQESAGSWFGRWGVNYVYGTSNVLCGLARLGVPAGDPMVSRAVRWLEACQNADGGWGESLESYKDPRWMGVGDSTPSQTAWALMGLLAYGRPGDSIIGNGVRWLVSHQLPADPVQAYEAGRALPIPRGWTWREDAFTGTGFPKHFYLRYHLYAHYFPMMALGRFVAASGRDRGASWIGS